MEDREKRKFDHRPYIIESNLKMNLRFNWKSCKSVPFAEIFSLVPKTLSLQTEAEEKKSANCSNKLLLTTHDVHYFGTYNSLFGTFHISCEIWLNFTISGS